MRYDVIIIGSGPGGYVCAIRCAQLGFKVALVEKSSTLGGTCLNVGCIPSKALLDSSEQYHLAQKRFADHGISVKGLEVDFSKMISRKDDVVTQTVKGIDFLMKKNKVDVFNGIGSLVDSNTVLIKGDKIDEEIKSDHIVLATGSTALTPDMFNYDGIRIITSTEALEIKELPESMVIVGGGVIGLELGSVYARLGTKVIVIEFMESILPGMDTDISKELQRSLKKLGISFKLKHAVTKVTNEGSQVKVIYKKRDTDEDISVLSDYCLIAIGRKPHTDHLGLQTVGIGTDENGRIEVNELLQTKVQSVYAIGDVIRGVMLAHKAEEEGMLVAETLAGQKPHIDYNLIPGVVYTWPEVAFVGQTEEELKKQGRAFKVGKFPVRALGRARASMDIEGMVKVLADLETDEILGVHMISARAADMIMEAVALMEFRASAEDMARICHPHPTYTEATKEAALAASENRALHI